MGVDDKRYDSKAIIGAAHGYGFWRPLDPDEFSREIRLTKESWRDSDLPLNRMEMTKRSITAFLLGISLFFASGGAGYAQDSKKVAKL